MTEIEGLDVRWLAVAIGREQWHFHRRLFERYQIVLEPGEFSSIVKSIRHRKALLIENRVKGSALYLVKIRKDTLPIYVVATGLRLNTVFFPSRRIVAKLHKANSLNEIR